MSEESLINIALVQYIAAIQVIIPEVVVKINLKVFMKMPNEEMNDNLIFIMLVLMQSVHLNQSLLPSDLLIVINESLVLSCLNV